MIGKCKVTMIYAKDSNTNGIGYDNKLSWHCPDDLKFFKEKTLNKVLIVGKNTFKELPPLKDRLVLVLTSKPIDENEFTFEQLCKFIKQHNIEEIVVIGGLKVYKTFLYQNKVDEIYETLLTFRKKNIYDTFASFSIKNFAKEEYKSIRTFDYDMIVNKYTKLVDK